MTSSSPSPLVHAPFAAVAAVVLASLVIIGFKAGMDAMTLALAILTGLTVGLGWMAYSLNRQFRAHESDAQQARMTAERALALLGAVPGGFCLFTPQGLMRDSARLTTLLGVEKIAHLDDIVAAIREAADFVAAFRKLQISGEGFAATLHTAKDGRAVHVTGRRLRAGRDGPLFDILWFLDNPVTTTFSEIRAELVHMPEMGTAASVGTEAPDMLLNTLPFPVWVRDGALALTRSNDAYAAALGTTSDIVLQEQRELASPTAKTGSGRALAADALAAGEARHERRHVIVAGKRRLLEITELPFAAANDKGLLGFAIDVTGEEDKETELERHLNAQRETLEHLGSAIAVYGADQRLEFYNRAYLKLWHADEGFLNEKPSFGDVLEELRSRRLLPEQTDFQRYKKERLALFTSLLEPREDLMHLPDGTSLRILVAPHPLGGLMFVHEDVTDRLALESSYNTLMAVQRETLDNLAEGIAVFGPDGKLGLFNPAFARIWKLPPDFLGEHPHITAVLERIKPLFDFGTHWDSFKNELVAYTLDRNARKGRVERADRAVIEYQTAPLPDGAVLNSYMDVTDSIKVEQALRASNAALATADRLKSEFVANVSYQLRTPLNTIIGFAEILSNEYFGALNERQHDYARTIMEASRKLLLLINDVLDLATIQAGRMALERQTLVVGDVLNEVRQMVIEWARQESLEIAVDCPADTGSFHADEQRVKQVLFNLISNAIKYTPAGGQITLSGRREGDWIVLGVADTGVGIPEADRERVFGSFERANPQSRQAGTGLGLSLVKSFVELHGGRVEITSQPGKGTAVTCYLPVGDEAAVKIAS